MTPVQLLESWNAVPESESRLSQMHRTRRQDIIHPDRTTLYHRDRTKPLPGRNPFKAKTFSPPPRYNWQAAICHVRAFIMKNICIINLSAIFLSRPILTLALIIFKIKTTEMGLCPMRNNVRGYMQTRTHTHTSCLVFGVHQWRTGRTDRVDRETWDSNSKISWSTLKILVQFNIPSNGYINRIYGWK